ncbi:unnamed protein product, partial [Amoebophrya sp. A25]|eukprot:GSA25T00022643001.1
MDSRYARRKDLVASPLNSKPGTPLSQVSPLSVSPVRSPTRWQPSGAAVSSPADPARVRERVKFNRDQSKRLHNALGNLGPYEGSTPSGTAPIFVVKETNERTENQDGSGDAGTTVSESKQNIGGDSIVPHDSSSTTEDEVHTLTRAAMRDAQAKRDTEMASWHAVLDREARSRFRLPLDDGTGAGQVEYVQARGDSPPSGEESRNETTKGPSVLFYEAEDVGAAGTGPAQSSASSSGKLQLPPPNTKSD